MVVLMGGRVDQRCLYGYAAHDVLRAAVAHAGLSRATSARDDDVPWTIRLAAEEPFRAAGLRALKGSRFAVLSSDRAHAISAHAIKGLLTTSSAALELPRSAGRGPGYPRNRGHHAADEGCAEQPQRPATRHRALCQASGQIVERLPYFLPAAARTLIALTAGAKLTYGDEFLVNSTG